MRSTPSGTRVRARATRARPSGVNHPARRSRACAAFRTGRDRNSVRSRRLPRPGNAPAACGLRSGSICHWASETRSPKRSRLKRTAIGMIGEILRRLDFEVEQKRRFVESHDSVLVEHGGQATRKPSLRYFRTLFAQTAARPGSKRQPLRTRMAKGVQQCERTGNSRPAGRRRAAGAPASRRRGRNRHRSRRSGMAGRARLQRHFARGDDVHAARSGSVRGRIRDFGRHCRARQRHSGHRGRAVTTTANCRMPKCNCRSCSRRSSR